MPTRASPWLALPSRRRHHQRGGGLRIGRRPWASMSGSTFETMGETRRRSIVSWRRSRGRLPRASRSASDVRTAMEAAVADRLGVPLVVNRTDAPGLPGPRQEWVFSVEAAGDLEARAYATARALFEAIEAARTIDPVALRTPWRTADRRPYSWNGSLRSPFNREGRRPLRSRWTCSRAVVRSSESSRSTRGDDPVASRRDAARLLGVTEESAISTPSASPPVRASACCSARPGAGGQSSPGRARPGGPGGPG